MPLSLLDDKTKLLEYISSCLKPKLIEKKKFGEVFTPVWLIEEMLNKLKEYDPNCFKEPNKKWLDPAVGMGNFIIVLYYKLMEELPDKKFKTQENKKKHILENMLYMSELNKKNCFLVKQILDPTNDYKINLFEGDSLTLDIKKEFNVEKFDYVIGNPPYNAYQKAKGKRGGGDSLWNKFVIKFINVINPFGKLMFIHPSGWRKPESEKSKYRGLFKLMTKDNQLHYLEIHNTKDGMKVFNSGTRYDWYIIERTKKYKTSIIKDELGIIEEIDLSIWYWLPNKNFNLIKNLLGDGCNIIYNRTNYGSDKVYVSTYESRKKYVSSKETNEFKYPLIHSTPKSGTRYYYSSRNDLGHFGISKIIFGETGIYDVIIDMEGKYGMTQHSMAIQVDTLEEGRLIKEAICSESFKEILQSCSWSNYRIDWRLFKYLRKDFYMDFLNKI